MWADKSKNLKNEISHSEEVVKLLGISGIEDIFSNKNLLKNIDFIFSRSIEKD